MNEQTTRDAQEFGAHIKQGGWRLGLLVARNVEKGTGGRPTKNPTAGRGVSKVGVEEFAKIASEKAGVAIGRDRIRNHFDAWEKAALDGLVTAAADLSPGEDPQIDWDTLPDWNVYYVPVSGGPNGGKNRAATKEYAKTVMEQLPPEDQASVSAEIIDTPDVTEALGNDEEAVDHVMGALTRSLPKRGKTKRAKGSKILEGAEMLLGLMAYLGKLRQMYVENPDDPSVLSGKELVGETWGMLNGDVSPESVAKMISDMEEHLRTQ